MAQRLLEYGVDTRNIAVLDTETAQAIIMVDPEGENAILLHPGANAEVPQVTLQAAMAEADTGEGEPASSSPGQPHGHYDGHRGQSGKRRRRCRRHPC